MNHWVLLEHNQCHGLMEARWCHGSVVILFIILWFIVYHYQMLVTMVNLAYWPQHAILSPWEEGSRSQIWLDPKLYHITSGDGYYDISWWRQDAMRILWHPRHWHKPTKSPIEVFHNGCPCPHLNTPFQAHKRSLRFGSSRYFMDYWMLITLEHIAMIDGVRMS